MFSYTKFVIYYCGAVTMFLVSGQEIPTSPCPDVFQYEMQPNADIYGRITIPYDGSSDIQLGVNASMKGYYTDKNKVKLRIKMNTPVQDLIQRKADSLSYDIYFPFQNVIPKITKIQFNNKQYCTGPPEELIPGTPGVTSLWSGHNYYFQNAETIPSASESNIPETNVEAMTPKQRLPQFAFTTARPSSEKITCGVPKLVGVPLILGGKEITDGMFPWLAAMFTTNGNGYEYKCTANLVSEKHVVTAARCVNFFKLQIVQAEDIIFVFGKSNLKHWATSGATIRGASAVHTNPNFNADSGHGDISVITLDKPLEFSSTIAPICLWEGDNSIDDMTDKTGVVAGWGADEGAQKSGKYSISVAKSIEMPIVSQDSCLYSNLSYFQLTSNITFCAGQRDGTGTCIGDSGAGFMLKKNGKFYLRGIASIVLSNKGKCDLTNFMVFCDAGKLTEWIRQTMY